MAQFTRRNTAEKIPSRFTVERREEVKEVAAAPGPAVLDKTFSTAEEVERNFLLLSVAYAANIGGTGVVTGSPPNLVVPESLGKCQPQHPNRTLT